MLINIVALDLSRVALRSLGAALEDRIMTGWPGINMITASANCITSPAALIGAPAFSTRTDSCFSGCERWTSCEPRCCRGDLFQSWVLVRGKKPAGNHRTINRGDRLPRGSRQVLPRPRWDGAPGATGRKVDRLFYRVGA